MNCGFKNPSSCTGFRARKPKNWSVICWISRNRKD